MEKELERYYEDRFVMFSDNGWKDFIIDMQEMKAGLTDIMTCTPDTLENRKGQLRIIEWVLGLETMSRDAFKQLLEDE